MLPVDLFLFEQSFMRRFRGLNSMTLTYLSSCKGCDVHLNGCSQQCVQIIDFQNVASIVAKLCYQNAAILLMGLQGI